ncbi:MAG: hypothetical protein ACI9XO_000178 [Paraglaciecola sp.]|jgi:hypothetical protein
MVSHIRQAFNANFTDAKYQALLRDVEAAWNHLPPFKICETPIFFGKDIRKKLFDACEQISDVLVRPDFKELSKNALLKGQVVPNEDDHTLFLQMDFGICENEHGNLTPQLIEAQGFPSLYFYQNLLAEQYQKHFDIPDNYSHLFGGLTSESYLELLRKNIVGDSKKENVILLEVEPSTQATRIDFHGAEHYLGIKTKCISDIIKIDNDVFYKDETGKLIQVERIVNRVIFDELIKRDDLKRQFYFTQEANVNWVGHPNWFFRISKHTMPILKSQYVPDSFFLSELQTIPTDLHNYVLKPLYSFAGSGVIINLNRYDLDMIKDPENYILQRKVAYAPIIETPDGKAKCEVRMLMLWEKGAARPRIINNLTRLTKGEMVGVKYNIGKTWVGGSVGFFEQ